MVKQGKTMHYSFFQPANKNTGIEQIFINKNNNNYNNLT